MAVFASHYIALFGAGYADGAAVVVLLALAMLVASVVGVVDTVVLMAGRTSWNLATTLAALAVNVVLDVVLIPPFGIVGAAIGWCAAIVVANLASLALCWRGLGLHPFRRLTTYVCALSAVCFGALPLVGRAVSEPTAVAGLAIGIGVYAVLLWRSRRDLDLVHLRSRGSAA